MKNENKGQRRTEIGLDCFKNIVFCDKIIIILCAALVNHCAVFCGAEERKGQFWDEGIEMVCTGINEMELIFK